MVLEVASLRLEELVDTAAVFDSLQAPALAGARMYYRRSSDVALLALQYSAASLSGAGMTWLAETCRRIGAAVIDPTRMSENDRRSFYQGYLHNYETRLEDLPNARAAVGALLNRLSGTSEIVDVSQIEELRRPTASDQHAHAQPHDKPSTIVTMATPAQPPTPSDRLSVHELSALLPQRSESPPAEIDVRFVRGGAWTAARLRALSLRGAYLVTGAPPRVGDLVDMVLSYGDAGALVRGAVYHVTSAQDTQAGGSVGFAVRFPLEPSPTRSQLIALLTKARAAGVTIKPPPTRSSVRFPVNWPIALNALDGGQLAAHPIEATDISSGGMFLATSEMLGTNELAFCMPTDEDEAPISGLARVVRTITPQEARQRGIREGYGAEIMRMTERDRQRWDGFLERVQKRTERRLLVGATAARLDEIVLGLTSAGYSVTTGSDPGTLVRLAESEARPPDAAIIDISLSVQGPGQWLEHVFASRNVPCVTVRGDAKRTRLVVDQLLGVG